MKTKLLLLASAALLISTGTLAQTPVPTPDTQDITVSKTAPDRDTGRAGQRHAHPDRMNKTPAPADKPCPMMDEDKPCPMMMKHAEDAPRHQMKRPSPEQFAQELGLSDEQKKQAEALRQQGRADLEPLMKKMKTLKKEMDTLRDKNKQAFESILTPEQREKLSKMHQKHQMKQENNRPKMKHQKEHAVKKD